MFAFIATNSMPDLRNVDWIITRKIIMPTMMLKRAGALLKLPQQEQFSKSTSAFKKLRRLSTMEEVVTDPGGIADAYNLYFSSI